MKALPFLLSLLLTLPLCAKTQVEIHTSAQESMALLQITQKKYSYHSSYQDNFEQVLPQHLKIPHLYSTQQTYSKNQQQFKRWLCLLPKKDVENSKKTLEEKKKQYSITLHQNSTQYDKLKSQWKESLLEKLRQTLREEEDTEFETLLYMHIAGKKPKNAYRRHWKRDELAKVLFSLSGLQDIQDALPKNKKGFKTQQQELNQAPPAPLQIPQVQSKETKISSQEALLANYAPRSCYYIEFPSVDGFQKGLDYLSREFEKWSPGTYPKTSKKAINDLIAKAGLSEAYLKKQHGNIARIAIVGWDFYWQSGSNLALIIEEKSPLDLPNSVKHQSRENNILIVASSPKLLQMAQKAKAQNKNLSSLNNYRYARKRLKKVDSKEQEQAFLYFSDYWFTNLLSPRWQIHTRRQNNLASRIRMAELLKLIARQETQQKNITLEATKKHFKNNSSFQWILADLVEGQSGKLEDSHGQSLYNFSAIDELPFDKVSKEESQFYKNFTRSYSRLWRQMDPIALQITRQKDLWKSRLYISPISNISHYRQIQNIVLTDKKKHLKNNIQGTALGLSAIFQTGMIKPFAMGLKLPMTLQIGAKSFDFSPRITAASQILREDNRQSYQSFMRAPAFIEAPAMIVQGVMPMARLRSNDSQWPGIFETAFDRSAPLFGKVFGLNKEGWTCIASNPLALKQVQQQKTQPQETAAVASDIYAYADLKEGYMLKEYLTYEAMKNRSYASWRRLARLERINHLLHFDRRENRISYYNKKNWVKEFEKKNLFPKVTTNSQVQGTLPVYRSEKTHYRYGDWRKRNKLPEIINRLEKAELFISVEDNALLFETHLNLKETNEPRRRNQRQEPRNQQGPTTTVDFE